MSCRLNTVIEYENCRAIKKGKGFWLCQEVDVNGVPKQFGYAQTKKEAERILKERINKNEQ